MRHLRLDVSPSSKSCKPTPSNAERRKNKMIYAGIGARRTPGNVLHAMVSIGEYMARNGHVLRSGGAQGADHAFEIGCDFKSIGAKEVYLPWKGFEQSKSEFYDVCPKAMAIASQFHPSWPELSQGTRKLMGRNAYQMLGLTLDTPADLVICWTPEGKVVGGTGQSIRMAKFYDIPVCNLGSDTLENMNIKLSTFMGEEP
jgi:hypothetical protein